MLSECVLFIFLKFGKAQHAFQYTDLCRIAFACYFSCVSLSENYV